MSLLRRLTAVTLATTYGLVVLGGLVRATESGLGCGPDWPRCDGRIIPVPDHQAWIEFGHRFVAAVVVGLTAALAVVAWRRARDRRDLVRLAAATVPLVLAQAGLGAIVVIFELQAVSVVAHLLMAMLLLAVLLALFVSDLRPPKWAPTAQHRRFARAASAVALGVLAVMLLGSYVSGRNAGLAFTDWPLFDGSPHPGGRGTLGFLHGGHRLLAAASGLSIIWLARYAKRIGDPSVRRLVIGAGGIFAVQVLVGAANVWTELHAASRTLHLALAAGIWSMLVAAALAARRPIVAPAPGARSHVRTPAWRSEGPLQPVGLARIRAYVALTKPRVIELLLVTTVPAMVLAHGGLPSFGLVAAVLLGGALAAGGANSINCYIDRERDRQMRRTRRRPLPRGEVTPRSALRFGIVLEILAFSWLWLTTNLLAASLAIAATVFYVFVYSMWLKPRTAQNIVIGGAAGAVPVLVGWAAVTSGLGLPAWILFAIIFVWTPPHFWALAMRYREDYAAAGVPMLPVVAGADTTTRQILFYAVVVVVTTIALHPAAGMSALYLIVSVALGAAFVWRAFELRRERTTAAAMRLFTFSNTYLALLFGAVALDVLLVSGA